MRKLTDKEIEVISFLISESAQYTINSTNFLSDVYVTDMDDGGMGSILFSSSHDENERVLDETIVSATFKDKDNVEVSVALNIDAFGDLFELDVWKVDFSKLIKWPEINQISIQNS